PARACRLNFLEGAGGGAPRPVGPAGRARRARRMPVERAPARNGDSPVLEDGEELRLSEQRTRFVHGPAGDEGEGVLHLTTRRIVWLGATSGYAMDYPFVTLHAISRDKAAWPDPCLYCQLRCEEVEGEEEEEPEIPEVRFVPSDPAHLQTVFQVFSEMSALNPDGDGNRGMGPDFQCRDFVIMVALELSTPFLGPPLLRLGLFLDGPGG
ncbi:unnamed protein product, partial [Prorocentrum cordatum]